MSRSRRNSPVVKETTFSRDTWYGKRKANKKVRQVPVEDEIADGKSYRKYYESWKICDYRSYLFDPEDIEKYGRK